MNVKVSLHGETEIRTSDYSGIARHLILQDDRQNSLDITLFGKNRYGLIQAINKAESQRARRMLNDIRQKLIPKE